MTKITITKDAMAKLAATTKTGSATTMTDMEPENPGPLLNYMRSRNADRIEQLTAELADAEALIESQAKDHASNNIRFAEAEHRAKVAEAERDRLRIALTDAESYLGKGLDKMAYNILRAALKGESHE